MKKKLLTVLSLLLVLFINAQVIRPFSHRYYNPSVKGNVVYVSNSILTVAGAPTGNPGTGEVAPNGIYRDNYGKPQYINVSGATTIIPWWSTWKYCDSGYAPGGGAGTAWRNTVYAPDAAWPTVTGNAPSSGSRDIGFGDGDEVFPYMFAGCGARPAVQLPACNPKYSALYFRQVVNIPNVSLYNGFQISLKRDDGAVIYVNGVEVARSNMPAGVVTYGTFASSNVENSAISTAEDDFIQIPTTNFVNGNNTIAVELHRASGNDVDMSFRMLMEGYTEYSSSTADLNLWSCSRVLWAGLYWGAGQGINNSATSWITGENTCKLRIPGSATYTNITATSTDYHNSTVSPGLNHTGYKCYADITSLINTTNPNGTYTVADIVGPIGVAGVNNNCYGGWTIVVAFENSSDILRELNVFDGNVIVDMGQPAVDIALNGFLTPPVGPVSCELGAVLYDGDRGNTDEFSFRQNGAPTYLNLTPNSTSLLNDMWNSTISYKGTIVTSRNPAFQNTVGYDADIIELPNTSNANLGNSQTSATIRLSSPQENYLVQVVSATISIKSPNMQTTNTATDVNGGALVGGDELNYNIQFTNNGNDSSLNTYIVDTIPLGASYKPGTLRIGGVAKTDAAGDDEAEYDFANNRVIFRVGNGANATTGGRVVEWASVNVSFSILVPDICAVRACNSTMVNQAYVHYTGAASGDVFVGRSGRFVSGCFVESPQSDLVSGGCRNVTDTIMSNVCPATNKLIPVDKYIGYQFYSARPFIAANAYNPATLITSSRTIYAYFNGPGICDDTLDLRYIIVGCPDIDDDKDGIPDYVEFNNPLALADHNSNGIPNWRDATYPGYVDNNIDGYNDFFDAGADADNDGIPNYIDTNFPGFVDANGDGVSDIFDKDLDGIINQYDKDSDNDGIPDVVESYGVDTNGDGAIDNFSDSDGDGLSQNVDASAGGITGSGNGLGNPDLDNDGIPNYLDIDSDNDGIPDIIEAGGSDSNNNGLIDAFSDSDNDGISDNIINASALLLSGVDANNDGRADNWPNKNLDNDLRPNAYDMDSDGDGIVDVIEAGLPDANLNGIVDGVIGTNGWSATVSGFAALTLRNTDASGNPDHLDIDSDDDGIPDNIEGMSTVGYIRPTSTADTDGDGLVNHYDNVVGFGGTGIQVYDHDGDGTPDYRDLDTDADGQPDIIEGNDFNLNGYMDDDVTLTGIDTDGDGLDNRFDSLNSVINIKGTSYNMGTGGSTSGDAAPGTSAPVQKRTPAQVDRDWRYVGVVLPVQILSFSGNLQNTTVKLNWTIITPKELDHFEIERSLDNQTYIKIGILLDAVKVNEQQGFGFNDDISGITNNIIYYRLKIVGKSGEVKYSNVLLIRLSQTKTPVSIVPNPAVDYASVKFFAEKDSEVTLRLIDNIGKIVLLQKQKVSKGNNTLQLNNLAKYSTGVYTLQVMVNNDIVIKKLILSK